MTENVSTEATNSHGVHGANESIPSLQATESEVGSGLAKYDVVKGAE